MKKRSIGLMLLSALLCLSMLLISCSQPATNEETTSETNAPETKLPATVYPVPEDVNINCQEVMSKWNEYITFAAPGEKPQYADENEYLFNGNDAYKTVAFRSCFAFVRTTHTYWVPAEYSYLPDVEVVGGYTYDIYNTQTGEKIMSEYVAYDENSTTNAVLTIDALPGPSTTLPVLEVYRGKYVALEEDEFGNVTYDFVETYSYYDENGELIKGDLEDRVVVSAIYDGTQRFELDGKIYAYKADGELVYVFDKGSEKVIPNISDSYGSYYYVNCGNEVIVLDKDYNKLCDYTYMTNYDDVSTATLSNGNLLITYIDGSIFGPYDEELVQTYVILNVNTGATTSLKKDFVVERIYTAKDAKYTGIGFKGSYQLAIINKMEEGIPTGDRVFAILDNELKIVAELPNFVKGQINLLGMTDESTLVVAAANVAGDIQMYTVDVKKNETKLYINLASSEYRQIKNGFIYGDKLYNTDCEELLDLSECTSCDIKDGFIIINSDYNYTLCYIENGELVKKNIIDGTGSYAFYGEYILVEDYYDYYYYDPSETETGTESGAETGSSIPGSRYDSRYKIYSLSGDELVEVYSRIVILNSGDGFVFYKVVDDYNEHYYTLK